MPFEENAMLGPYRIAGMIGEGGMGAVYRAKDTRLGRDVAIKVLTAVTLSDKERLSRFEQEARATGMLNHPNLLTIYDVGNADGTPFLVSELLEGETLRDRLVRGPIPARKCVELAMQMANGLSAAHEKGVVHRDLKPENVFVTKQGRLKILDFGIAKLTRMGADGPTFQPAATEPGMVLGTVGYMSPEQVRGEALDPRSDIFAFGTILYEMLTGARAFKGGSSIETLSAILREDPPDISETVPSTLERLVRRCLEKNREERFQSARDLAFNLETLSSFSSPGTFSSAASQPHTVETTLRQHTPTAVTLGGSTRVPTTAAQVHKTSVPPRPRPPTVAQRRPKRVSPVLLSLLYVVSIVGAGWGGWYYATHMKAAPPEMTFRRMTFRRGEVRGARFTPDGDTIVYSAAWDGLPTEIFVASRQSPEARPLGIADAEVLAVSKTTELAVLMKPDRITGIGTLARVPLAGGTPRLVADNVLKADWAPDGSNLAIVRVEGGVHRLEYPIGSVKYRTPHEIRDVRVSPDGTKIAFVERYGGKNDVVVVGPGQPEPLARGWSRGATGLAWSPDGTEVWLTGSDTPAPPALYAVKMTGETRTVSRLTGSMRLYDISAAGRVLLTNGMWRAALLYQPPGETVERDMSWLDWSVLADISADGRAILFSETREGGGTTSAVFLRRADSPIPVRIGDGYGDAISPDGRMVLCHKGPKLVLLPTGSGEPRELKVEGSFDVGAAWFSDSKRVVVAGALPKKGYQLHVLDTLEETMTPISPENIWGGTMRPFAIAPDGHAVAGMTADETIAIYPVDGSLTATPLPSAEKGEVPIIWSNDGMGVYVYRPTELPARVFRIDVATGARTLWREFSPSDPAGLYKIVPVVMKPDASAYAYNALRAMSDLYIAEGLH